jgi:hypothetical protein
MRTLVSAAALLVAMGTSEAPPVPSVVPDTRFAAPEIVIFSGGPLAKPVVVASWAENQQVLLTAEPREPLRAGDRRATTPRPVISMALFWGSQWGSYAASPARLATLKSVQANQYGQYYPAVAGARALVSVGSIRGPVSDSGLAVLRRHGIPTRAE